MELRGPLSCRLVEVFPESLGGLAELLAHWGVACERLSCDALARSAGEGDGALPRVDLVLIDTAIHAGLQAARRLVARRKEGGAPVVALCRKESSAAISQALAVGFDDALAFPMDEVELRHRIVALGGLVRAERERRRRLAILHRFANAEPRSFRFRRDRPEDRPALLLVGPASENQVRIANASGKAHVAYAGGKSTAHRMLAERPFDLIVVTLPGATANPVMRLQDLAEAPLAGEVGLLLAGPVEAPDRIRAMLALGFADIIQVPQPPELIRIRLDFWLQVQRLRRWLRDPPPGSVTLLALDAMSSLFNQGFLFDYIALLRAERRPAEPVMTVAFGLTGLAALHATLGHAAGNCLVAEVGRRLRALVRAEDLAACLGNGQFVVVTDELDERRALALAARIQTAISKLPIIYQGRPLPLELESTAAPVRAKDDPARALARAFRDLENRRPRVA